MGEGDWDKINQFAKSIIHENERTRTLYTDNTRRNRVPGSAP